MTITYSDGGSGGLDGSGGICGVYLGSHTVNEDNGALNANFRAYVYYNSNTTSQIDLHSLCQWVDNYGLPFNYAEYAIWTPSYSKVSDYEDPQINRNPIKQNEFGRMELDCSYIEYITYLDFDTSYNKEGQYVVIEMTVGSAALGGGLWHTLWYAKSPGTTYSVDFYIPAGERIDFGEFVFFVKANNEEELNSTLEYATIEISQALESVCADAKTLSLASVSTQNKHMEIIE